MIPNVFIKIAILMGGRARSDALLEEESF